MQNKRIQNPFQLPITIDVTKDQEVRDLIADIFRTKGSLKFHDMLQYLEKAVENKDIERAKIAAFYCTNVVLSQPTLNDIERSELIRGMCDEIIELEKTLEGEK